MKSLSFITVRPELGGVYWACTKYHIHCGAAYHSHITHIEGESYRLRQSLAKYHFSQRRGRISQGERKPPSQQPTANSNGIYYIRAILLWAIWTAYMVSYSFFSELRTIAFEDSRLFHDLQQVVGPWWQFLARRWSSFTLLQAGCFWIEPQRGFLLFSYVSELPSL